MPSIDNGETDKFRFLARFPDIAECLGLTKVDSNGESPGNGESPLSPLSVDIALPGGSVRSSEVGSP